MQEPTAISKKQRFVSEKGSKAAGKGSKNRTKTTIVSRLSVNWHEVDLAATRVNSPSLVQAAR